MLSSCSVVAFIAALDDFRARLISIASAPLASPVSPLPASASPIANHSALPLVGSAVPVSELQRISESFGVPLEWGCRCFGRCDRCRALAAAAAPNTAVLPSTASASPAPVSSAPVLALSASAVPVSALSKAIGEEKEEENAATASVVPAVHFNGSAAAVPPLDEPIEQKRKTVAVIKDQVEQKSAIRPVAASALPACSSSSSPLKPIASAVAVPVAAAAAEEEKVEEQTAIAPAFYASSPPPAPSKPRLSINSFFALKGSEVIEIDSSNDEQEPTKRKATASTKRKPDPKKRRRSPQKKGDDSDEEPEPEPPQPKQKGDNKKGDNSDNEPEPPQPKKKKQRVNHKGVAAQVSAAVIGKSRPRRGEAAVLAASLGILQCGTACVPSEPNAEELCRFVLDDFTVALDQSSKGDPLLDMGLHVHRQSFSLFAY